ncbi:MAG: ferredoxin--NADP reductase, partial [Saprospiraceae bacterium]|nr:ferredoxin--NADP reductase [Saprospiraceae bacterium]
MSLFKKLFKKASTDDTSGGFISLTINHIRRETAKAVSLQFDKPTGWDFLPGQYLTFEATIDGSVERRAYSLSSLPSDDFLQVTVKETPTGFFSKYVNQTLQEGDSILVMPPTGKFTHNVDPSAHNAYVAAAGGSGITPIFSILKSVLEQEANSTFTLIYGNRTQEDIIFAAAIQDLQAKHGARFKVLHVLSDEERSDFTEYFGFVTMDMIKEMAERHFSIAETHSFFLCGPGPMIDTVKGSLKTLGASADQIKTELFTAPLNNDAKPKKEADTITTDAQVKITYGKESTTVYYTDKKKTVLDMALDNGIKVPFSCLNGVCSTCSAKLVNGTVA